MLAPMPVVLILLLALQSAEPSLLILNEAYAEKEAAQHIARSWQGFFLNDTGDGRIAPITLEAGERSLGCVDDPLVELRSKPAGALYAVSSTAGGRALRPAVVTSVRLDYPVSLSPGDSPEIVLPLGQRRYTLRREGVKEDLTDVRVTLSDGRETQVLFAANGFVDEPHFTVHWAGDMDSDGRLDLIVTLSHKYSVFPTRLLLSSVARQGELAGVAAAIERSAC